MVFPDNYNHIADFLLNPRYRITRYTISIAVLVIITVSMVLNNINYLGGGVYEALEWFVYLLVMFGMIPLNVFVLAPRYLLRNRLTAYFIRIVLLIFITVCILGYMQMNLFAAKEIIEKTEISAIWVNFLSSLVSMGFLLMGTSTILLFRHWVKSNKRINELKSVTLQSEMDLLKSQINPHFLLNMLNNANVLIWKNKEEARQILYKLEDLLRYQLNETNKDRVLLPFDIRFLNDFLNLEKIRRDRFEFTITKKGDIEDVWVPSFLFIPFVENAVKHNPDSNHLSYIHLYFHVDGNKLEFCCENSKPLNKAIKKETGGLGLKNIQRRLALLYPGRHTLEISDEETKYTVKLELIL